MRLQQNVSETLSHFSLPTCHVLNEEDESTDSKSQADIGKRLESVVMFGVWLCENLFRLHQAVQTKFSAETCELVFIRRCRSGPNIAVAAHEKKDIELSRCMST